MRPSWSFSSDSRVRHFKLPSSSDLELKYSQSMAPVPWNAYVRTALRDDCLPSVVEAYHFSKKVQYTSVPFDVWAFDYNLKKMFLRSMKFRSVWISLNKAGASISFLTASHLASFATVTTLLVFSELSENLFDAPGDTTFEVALLMRRRWNVWSWMWTTKTARNVSSPSLSSAALLATKHSFKIYFSKTRLGSFRAYRVSPDHIWTEGAPWGAVASAEMTAFFPGFSDLKVRF